MKNYIPLLKEPKLPISIILLASVKSFRLEVMESPNYLYKVHGMIMSEVAQNTARVKYERDVLPALTNQIPTSYILLLTHDYWTQPFEYGF